MLHAQPILDRRTVPNPAKPARLLIAEDDAATRQLLEMALRRKGYEVHSVSNGQDALQLFDTKSFDAVLLDVDMPDMNGYITCQDLRKRTRVPILMLTGLAQTDDIIIGFQFGADGYVTKPFSPGEVCARLDALLRRASSSTPAQPRRQLAAGDVLMDEARREVRVAGKLVQLTPNEYDLLRYFLQHPDKPVSKETLMESVWNYENCDEANLVRVTISRLRSKIERDPANPQLLKTVHGYGYILAAGRKTFPASRPDMPRDFLRQSFPALAELNY